MRQKLIILIALVGLLAFLILAPYAVVLTVLAVIGLLTSLFFVATWTPFVIAARRRNRVPISAMSVVDSVTLPAMGVFVFGLRLAYTVAEGVMVPPDTVRAVIGISVWFMLTTATSLRAYIWAQTLRKHPRGTLHQVVTDQVEHRP